MQLDKETMKKIRWLIAFAVLLYLGVQNLNIVINTAKVLLSFLFPFIIGFGIAFILNVPMKFIEHHLFGKTLEQKKKAAEKLAHQSCALHRLRNLHNHNRYAGSSPGARLNICKYRKENRGKHPRIPEMD